MIAYLCPGYAPKLHQSFKVQAVTTFGTRFGGHNFHFLKGVEGERVHDIFAANYRTLVYRVGDKYLSRPVSTGMSGPLSPRGVKVIEETGGAFGGARCRVTLRCEWSMSWGGALFCPLHHLRRGGRRPLSLSKLVTSADCSRLVGAYEGTRARDLNQETVWQGHPVLRPLQGEE